MENNTDDSSSHMNHTLNTNWVVWYHSPTDKSWSKDSYKPILELESIEDYLVLENSWVKCLPSVIEGMYFVMRKFKNGTTIYPQWEDINNIEGGYWSFKVDNNSAQDVWAKLCKHIIGETICREDINPLQFNGISISPKKHFCIIKIWNNNSKIQDVNILSKNLQAFLNIDEVKYSEHVKNIERDTVKVNKYKERMKEFESRGGSRGGRRGGHRGGNNHRRRNSIGRF
jgi:hypothetical protein